MSSLLPNTDQEQQDFVSTFSDPFSSDKVESINFDIRKKKLFGEGPSFESTVRFRSGNTTGHHDIEANDFTQLVLKTQHFIKTL